MDAQLVWAPDPVDGYALGRVVDIGAGSLANIRLEAPKKGGNTTKAQKVECSIDQVFPAETDLTKDYDDNCKCYPIGTVHNATVAPMRQVM